MCSCVIAIPHTGGRPPEKEWGEYQVPACMRIYLMITLFDVHNTTYTVERRTQVLGSYLFRLKTGITELSGVGIDGLLRERVGREG